MIIVSFLLLHHKISWEKTTFPPPNMLEIDQLIVTNMMSK